MVVVVMVVVKMKMKGQNVTRKQVEKEGER